MYLFVDTETTGLPKDFQAPHTKLALWPRIVSVSWALFAERDSQLLYRYHIIRPNGFTIPSESRRVHGIDTQRAMTEGIDLAVALSQLNRDVSACRPGLLVAHNMAFDRPVLLAEYLRANIGESISALPTFCTMITTAELCGLYPMRNGQHKWPKLAELYFRIFGVQPSAAHHAGSDVLNCAKCFFHLQESGIAPRLPEDSPRNKGQ